MVQIVKATQAARSIILSIARNYKHVNLKALLIAVEESITQSELLHLASERNELQCLAWPIFIISLKKVLQYTKEGRSVKVRLTALAHSGECTITGLANAEYWESILWLCLYCDS